MDGQRALIYSRIRENRLDPSETDLDRARRQQQVIQATADKVTSFGTALKLPFTGGGIVKPLATDLSAGQVIQLGWAYFRADTKQCAPLSPRRRAGQRRRPVGHLRLRGQRRHDRDVHGPLRAARAAEGPSLRAGLRRRGPQAVSRRSVRGGGLLVARAGVLRRLLLVARSRSSRPSRRRRRPSPRPCATHGRSRSSRSPSPCNAPRRETAPSRRGSRRRSRSSRPERRSSSGRARTVCPFGQRYS